LSTFEGGPLTVQPLKLSDGTIVEAVALVQPDYSAKARSATALGVFDRAGPRTPRLRVLADMTFE